MITKPERRTYPLIELRVERRDAAPPQVAGHAALFNSLSEDLGGFREQIAPGAFAGALGGDVRALWNHDPNVVLGRTKNGTLALNEDDRGLAVRITPPDTQAARDVVTLIERGDVSQMSFAFRTLRDSWDRVNGEVIRTLLDVELFDVSPVTFPAYPETDIAVRSLEAWRRAQEAPQGMSLDLALRRQRLVELA